MAFASHDEVLNYLMTHPDTRRLTFTYAEFNAVMRGLWGEWHPYLFSVQNGYVGSLYGVPVFIEEEDAFLRMARELVETDG